eukprot:7385466-Alexandrium_andersonii.AAC.1
MTVEIALEGESLDRQAGVNLSRYKCCYESRRGEMPGPGFKAKRDFVELRKAARAARKAKSLGHAKG